MCLKGYNGTDGVLICGGTVRGDSTYGPGRAYAILEKHRSHIGLSGVITLGDILEILPFEDPVVILELDGESLWAAIEAGLSTWPAQEGCVNPPLKLVSLLITHFISRFPIISGFRVSWDSRLPAGHRVLGIWLVQQQNSSGSVTPFHSGSSTPSPGGLLQEINHTLGGLVDLDEVKRVKGGKKYSIVTREYMAQGHDGFVALKDQKYLVDDESGQMMSAIVRKYLLGEYPGRGFFPSAHLVVGCRFVQRMARMEPQERIEQLINAATKEVIWREIARKDRYDKHSSSRRDIVTKWKHAARLALRWSRAHYRDHIRVTEKEHMSGVDCFDGGSVRSRKANDEAELKETLDVSEDDIITIHPFVDGRFKDEGRSSA